MPRENPIGEYLRARRELVRPEDVELPDAGSHRRVPGLRARRSRCSPASAPDYYVRLEQGRDQHPSAQVLDALARALQLDEHATAHLHRLAAPPVRRRRRSPRPEKVPASILRLIASWSHTPAYVYGRYMDVLAANPLATAVAPYHAPGHNLVRAAFLDPRVRDMYADWEYVTESTVAGLRALVGPDVDDPRLNELVGELSVRSERFRQLWAGTTSGPSAAGQACSTILRSDRSSSATRSSRSPNQLPDARHLPRRTRHPERPSTHPAGCDRRRRARTSPDPRNGLTPLRSRLGRYREAFEHEATDLCDGALVWRRGCPRLTRWPDRILARCPKLCRPPDPHGHLAA